MTHLFDTSAILAHYLAESGAERVQALFDDPGAVIGICVVSLLEFETRLHAMGLNEADRRAEIQKYKQVIDEIVPVDEAVCARAAELKRSHSARLPSVDALIAPAASLRAATLVHRDPHFVSIPPTLLKQESLPAK